MLLRKPGLSGNLLLCQLLGTGQRHDYKGIFSSFKRKKIPPAYTNLGGLSETSGFCNEKPESDAPIIISGYLAPYFTEEDTDYLLEQINSMTPFELEKEQLLVGTHGQYTPAIGAALFYVKEFIHSV